MIHNIKEIQTPKSQNSMQIIKIGGSKILNQNTLQSSIQIIKDIQDKQLKSIIVISAFGKTSKNLKKTLNLAINSSSSGNNIETLSQENQKFCQQKLNQIFDFHLKLINYKSSEKLSKLFEELNEIINAVYNLNNYSKKTLDLVLSYGELIALEVLKIEIENYYSTQEKINSENITFIDATDFIVTDYNYNNADIDIEATKSKLNNLNLNNKVIITQGFIGRDLLGNPTTLGFESSNYTAIVLAELLNIKKLVIYSDTNGVLDSDPRIFTNNSTLTEINYEDAHNLSNLGLKIISEKMILSAEQNNIEIEYKSLFQNESNVRYNTPTNYTKISQNLNRINCPVFIVDFNYQSTKPSTNQSSQNIIKLTIYNLTNFDYKSFRNILSNIKHSIISDFSININTAHNQNSRTQTAVILINKDELKNEYDFTISQAKTQVNITYKEFETNFCDKLKQVFI